MSSESLITLFKPTIRRKDMDHVLTCMVQDHIGPGGYNREFGMALAHYLEAAGGVAVASYQDAILLALDVLGLVPGDHVVVSPLSPPVYMAALEIRNLKPLFADVDMDSGVLVPDEIARHKGKDPEKEPKAILLHYTLGFAPDMDAIQALGIPFIEDISQAMGGTWKDIPLGCFGEAAVLSLETTSIITTGGGAAVTVKKKNDFAAMKKTVDASRNLTLLPDMNSSLGIAQLKELGEFVRVRREILEVFQSSLMKSRHAGFIQKGEGASVPFTFPVVVSTAMQDVRQFAKKKGIETHAAFNETVITMYDDLINEFPNAKALLLRTVVFPLYPSLGRRNVENIAKVLSVLP